MSEDFNKSWKEIPLVIRLFGWLSPKQLCYTGYLRGREKELRDYLG